MSPDHTRPAGDRRDQIIAEARRDLPPIKISACAGAGWLQPGLRGVACPPASKSSLGSISPRARSNCFHSFAFTIPIRSRNSNVRQLPLALGMYPQEDLLGFSRYFPRLTVKAWTPINGCRLPPGARSFRPDPRRPSAGPGLREDKNVDTHAKTRGMSGARSQSRKFLLYRGDELLDGVDFLLFKIGLAALCTDPCRNFVERNVTTPAVCMEGGMASLHFALAMDALHFLILTLKSSGHSLASGT